MLGPILVATDGTPKSDPALRVAGEIACRDGRHVWVITVVDPGSPAVHPNDAQGPAAGIDARRQLALVKAREQAARVAHCTTWPVVAEEGVPATIVAEFAADIHASLIVVGMSPHGIIDRLTGAATTLALIRQATTPVLVATPWLMWPPRRVVAAVDRSAASDAALRLAAEVAAPDGMIEVVTVEPRDPQWSRRVPHEARRYPRIERVLARLRAGTDRQIRRRVLAGDPVTRLLDSITAESADLIVTGPRQGEVLGRMLRGEVTSTLLQRAPCAVLGVSEGAIARLSAASASSGVTLPSRLNAQGGAHETQLQPSEHR